MPQPASSIPIPRPLNAPKLTVGVADLQATGDRTMRIITHALGSCIGVTAWDPRTRATGMLHYMLPESKVSPDKAERQPAMFGDLGVPLLLERMKALGADPKRLVVCAAGGAEVVADGGTFRIGARNRTILRKLAWKHGLLLAADDTGGNFSRTITIDAECGTVRIRMQGEERTLWAA